MQRKNEFTIEGTWVRWSQYELHNATVVPAKGATLATYDPWATFNENVGKYRTVQQPYVALLELHRQLRALAVAGVKPTKLSSRGFLGGPLLGPQNEADEIILDWCNEHGLLGIVPIFFNSIRLYPTVDSSGKTTRVHHFRDGGDWYSMLNVSFSMRIGGRGHSGLPLEHEAKPGVTRFDWNSHLYKERSLNDIRDYFLPSPLGEHNPAEVRFEPPCPNTKTFWDCYGEPLSEFVRFGSRFTAAIDEVSHSEEESAVDNAAVQSAHRLLSGIAQCASPSFHFDSSVNRVSERRVSAGLLASYALMFLWDRIDDRRVLRCQNCDAYFVSDDRRARYCSPRCRNTAQGRRFRTKQEASRTEE